jgi:BirA family biotin operon repressor/biotin-[acetyl-CoA-carboxylase] ligase
VWLIGHTRAGRKLGGILIETLTADGQRQLVVGVGLNILPFDAGALDSGFAALQELDPGASAPDALARLAPALIGALRAFERDGFAAFAQAYAARDLLRGRAVSAQVAGRGGDGAVLAEGIAQGVAEDGALLVNTAAGVVRVSSGDVRVRLDRAAPSA